MTVYYAIVDGDPISSGGYVVANGTDDTIEGPDGKMRGVAYIGNQVWCNACKTWGTIVERSRVPRYLRTDHYLHGKQAVSDDGVACKCTVMPRLIPRYGMRESFHDTAPSAHSTFARQLPPSSSAHVIYDEQVTLTDCRGNALADTYYTVRTPDGGLIHGTTDSMGCTARHVTDGAQKIAVYLGHRE